MALTVGVDTFLSLADADAYFANRLRGDDWANADTAEREKALRLATAFLTRQRYIGSIASSSQILAWPRVGAVDHDGRSIASNAIPQAIRDATCEMAYRLLVDDFTVDDDKRGVRRVTAANVAIEYDGRAPDRDLPDIVKALIAPLLIEDRSDASVMLAF